jgi:hypothetical protein
MRAGSGLSRFYMLFARSPASEPSGSTIGKETCMFELLMLGLGVALFALAGLYVLGCERL